MKSTSIPLFLNIFIAVSDNLSETSTLGTMLNSLINKIKNTFKGQLQGGCPKHASLIRHDTPIQAMVASVPNQFY